MKSKIYQIFYDKNSKSKLDPHFLKYDNTNPVRPNEFEYGVMRNLYLNSCPFEKNNKYLGVLSWKFQQKTNLHPAILLAWMDENKGYDIYTVNPFPGMAAKFYNVWTQGEYFHPGMTEFVAGLFEKAGLDQELLTLRHNSEVACYCNYWIANQKFWNTYMRYTEKLYQTIYESDPGVLEILFIKKADKNINSGMFSFIFERMFSSVLAKHQDEFKVLPCFYLKKNNQG